MSVIMNMKLLLHTNDKCKIKLAKAKLQQSKIFFTKHLRSGPLYNFI